MGRGQRYKEILEKLEKLGHTRENFLVVTKTRLIDDIMEIYNSEHRKFGENRIQEMLAKSKLLPEDVEFHMIGKLQKDKFNRLLEIQQLTCVQSIESKKFVQ